MSAPITPNPQKIGCEFCDQQFTRKYNLTRHIIRKHILCENEEITQNSHSPTQNSHSPTQNSHNRTQNSHNGTQK